MALFKRKQNNISALPEIESYYSAEKKDNSIKRWLLAGVSVLIASALLVGLFLGGKWLYNTVVNRDDAEPVAVETTEEESEETSDESKTEEAPSTTNSPSTSTGTSSTNTTTPSTTAQQPAATTNQLTNTGPESVIPVFFITTIFGILVYRHKELRKLV